MILREALSTDLPPLTQLAERAWSALSIPYDPSAVLPRLSTLPPSFRTIVLYDGPALSAALVAQPSETPYGPGFEILAFLVEQNHPRRLDLLDALSLYALTLALSERRPGVISCRLRSVPGPVYGRDWLAMPTLEDPATILQIGNAPDMIAAIIARHPQWAPSL
jgi:hypothetical protein